MSKSELRNLIILFRTNSLLTLSWGIYDMIEKPHGIEFYVKGFLYQGRVSVDGNDGNYYVTIGQLILTANESNLIETIDKAVESDSDFYNLSKKSPKVEQI